MHDAAIRTEALNYKHSYVVSAPAGSGKTELLIQRFLTLLTTVTQPESVLALTFTNKAAAEMQNRVHTYLLAQEPPDINSNKHVTWRIAQKVKQCDAKFGWNLLQNTSKLKICTLDSFCMQIVKNMPITSELGKTPTISTEPEKIYHQAVYNFHQHIAKNSSIYESFNKVLLHFKLDSIKVNALLAELLQNREQWINWIMQFKKLSSLEQKSYLESILQTIVANELAYANSMLPDKIKTKIYEILTECVRNKVKLNTDYNLNYLISVTPFPSNDIAVWKLLTEIIFTKNNKLRKKFTAQQGFPSASETNDLELKKLYTKHKADMAELIQALTRDNITQLLHIHTIPWPVSYSQSEYDFLYAIISLLPHLMAELMVEFRRRQEVDYIYISQTAIAALSSNGNPELDGCFNNNIKHLLIDEFQDTSSSQYNLLQILTSHWTPSENSIFIVGDPMQSIYKFRQANVSLFMHVQKNGFNDHFFLKSLQLNSNFRSNASLIAWINSLFKKLSPNIADIYKGNTIYYPSTATIPPVDDAVKWYVNTALHSYKNIIHCVQSILANYPGDSIAILVRSRNKVSNIIQELRQANISVSAIEIESLMDYPIIQDLLILTKALYSPTDKIAWLSLLRTPWCGLMLDDISMLTKSSDCLVIEAINLAIDNKINISKDGYQRLQYLHLCLKDSQSWQEDRLAVKVRKLWRKLDNGYPSTYAKNNIYLDMFFNIINQYENDIENIENKLARSYIDNVNTKSCIDIMTIHKAKGLEFDHVLLPDLSAHIRTSSKPLLIWDENLSSNGTNNMLFAPYSTSNAKIYNFLYEREKIKFAHENKRLLYVATTRAKKHLHIFAHINNTEGQTNKLPPATNGSLLSLIQQYDSHNILKSSRQQQAETNSISSKETPLKSNHGSCAKQNGTDDIDNSVALDHSLTVQRYRNIPQYHPPEQDSENIACAWQEPTKRAVGEIVHAILAEMAQKPLANHSYLTTEKCIHLLASKSVPAPQLLNAASDVMLAINNMLSNKKFRWILDYRHKNSLCENSISGYIDNTIQHRVIDRTFIDKKNHRWIIDYKLTHYRNNKFSQLHDFINEQANIYKEQLINYSKFFQNERRTIKMALCFPLLNKLYVYKKSN